MIADKQLMYPLTLTEAWQKMEEFHERGLVKSIGLSSFPAEEIEKLAKVWKIKPSINQVSSEQDLPIISKVADEFRSSIIPSATIYRVCARCARVAINTILPSSHSQLLLLLLGGLEDLSKLLLKRSARRKGSQRLKCFWLGRDK